MRAVLIAGLSLTLATVLVVSLGLSSLAVGLGALMGKVAKTQLRLRDERRE